MTLLDRFCALRGESTSSLSADQRQSVLQQLTQSLQTARKQFPNVAISDDQWLSQIAVLAPQPICVSDVLDGLATNDLYLAGGCSHRDPAALRICTDWLVREAAFAAGAARISDTLRDEAIAVTQSQMFVIRETKPAAIGDYAGRGALRGWLRISVAREMVRLAKKQQQSVELADQLVGSAGFEDPLLAQLKVKYRTEMATAFRTSLSELPARDRTLLRYQLVDGLSIDDIGAIYRVHRATAARWLAKIREDLIASTRGLMSQSLGVDTGEAASIVRLVQSQLDVSVIKHL
jgi:RNA polymerase sigma-70 factor, ECF subfamily